MPSPPVGIDLGTTFSAIAYVNDAGEPVVIPNREGRNITPSAVLVNGDQFIVGQPAINQALARPNDVARWMKRQLGDPDFKFQGRFTPEQISAEILKKLVADATAFFGEPVSRAVITCPAYFTAQQRARTRAAGELAGLKVLELRDEPVAAAIHFGIRGLKDGESVLVCDLGGGTYDATVLVMENSTLTPRGTSGSRELGGVDWSRRMAELLAELIEAKTGSDPNADEADRERLEELAETAKCGLSGLDQIAVRWGPDEITVLRADFETRCSGLMNEVLDKTTEAGLSAKIPIADITHVLLVGGSSRLDSFAEAVGKLTGKKPRRARNPDEAIALGAALVASGYTDEKCVADGVVRVSVGKGDMMTTITVVTTASHALGTRVADANLDIVSDPIIPENSKLPASAEKDYVLGPQQETFQVPVVELDSFGNVQNWHCNFRFYGVPKRNQKSPIKVRFEVDAHSKVPDVTAIDLLTGQKLDREQMAFKDPEIAKGGGGGDGGGPMTVVLAVDCSGSMSGSKIDEARRAMEEIAKKYLAPGSSRQLSIVNFGGEFSIYPAKVLVKPTSSIDEIIRGSARLIVGGGTPMDAGMERIREVLEVAPGKRLAIILTDGMPDNRLAAENLARTLKSQGIVLGTVPIGSDANKDFLKAIGQLESDLSVDNSGRGMAGSVLDILSKA